MSPTTLPSILGQIGRFKILSLISSLFTAMKLSLEHLILPLYHLKLSVERYHLEFGFVNIRSEIEHKIIIKKSVKSDR